MTYLRRAVKYFIQLCLIFVLIIGALMLTGMVPTDVTAAFRNGWQSLWMILGLFAVMSATYPFFGYGKRNVRATGDPSELWPDVEHAMELREYVPAGETPEGGRRYRLKSGVARAARLWEDSVTLTPQLGGFQAEGLVRDLARVVMTLHQSLNDHEY